jgi:outer membrane protein assembly factor BamE (lipoprotein component of BamABCDE complex)
MFLRTLFLAAALVFAFGLAACSKFGGGSGTAWHGDAQKAHQITAGMSQAEVKSLLGEPSTTQVMKIADESLTTWYYVGDKDNVNVVFDTKGTVTAAGLNGAGLWEPSQN